MKVRFRRLRVMQRGMMITGSMLMLGVAGFVGAQQKHAPAAKPVMAKVEYNRDIRPILSGKCFACHGQDPKQVQAGLRLDLRDNALGKLANGKFAIVPGKPAASELIDRVMRKSGPLQMPPVGSHKVLNDEERQLLQRWIAQGAEYKAHWAFVRPQRPALPVVKQKAWPRSPIDSFVLARLEQEGLHPASYTDRVTLLRRVSLDLTGIPPTPEEIDAFVHDTSPKAYEKVVDRLLASPRYGERMAMSWLDGARYADSNGFQADYERYQWRWRDWVIDAFNRNMPYDEFTVEQIAGDLLPGATMDQKLATGFNRNHRINTEGGVIPEEWRVETVIDRVETTSQVWLGLTTGCARCHDHKYDPISQKEFYQFYAFFNNVPESGTGVETPVNHPPIMRAPTSEQQQKLAAFEALIKTLDAQGGVRLAANRQAADSWKLDTTTDADTVFSTGLVARYALGTTPVASMGSVPKPKAVGTLGADAGRATGGVALDGKSYIDLGNVGDFDRTDKFSYGAWVNPATGNGAVFSHMDAPTTGYRGFDLYLFGGRPAVHIISHWPDNALKVNAKATVPNNQWSHLFVTYDGSAKPEGVKIYINGKPVGTDTEFNALTGTLRSQATAKIGTRTADGPFTGKIDDLLLYQRALTPAEVAKLATADPALALLRIPAAQRTEAQKQAITRAWSLKFDPGYAAVAAKRDAAEAERVKLDAQVSTVMVMDEMPKPRACNILIRGQYDHPGEPVTAGLPAALGTLPAGYTNNRLGLAKWIASPDNPLTARVFVNRLWEKFFGIGIVATSEDFGVRAEYPSHPELLDWLATEFVRVGWDVKAIQKTIVMSATYCQSSHVRPEIALRDPDNRLLSHGPRFRLPAELIRDQALAVSGLLTEQVGGPSVRPYQPDGIWDEVSSYGNLHNYKHDMGANLYRRSFYTIWKRTAAPPLMSLLDVPGREVCRVRRSRTDTPLQALALLNDVTFIEASRALAQHMLTEGGSTPETRLAYAFRRTLGRTPTAAENQILAAGIQKRIAHYRADTASALKLVSIGDTPRDPKLDVPELAAYTLTCSVLLNLDETLTKE
jgi:mono/diheme cytochrome c family protein